MHVVQTLCHWFIFQYWFWYQSHSLLVVITLVMVTIHSLCKIAAIFWHVWIWRTYCIHASRKVLPLWNSGTLFALLFYWMSGCTYDVRTWVQFWLIKILLSSDRHALVSSKTKVSKKVYTLHLEKEALIRSSDSELTWRVTNFSDSTIFLLKDFCYFWMLLFALESDMPS